MRRDSREKSATTTIQEILSRRRETGRQAQARYRQRQIQATRERREENDKLKAVIAEIVEATRCSNGSRLLEAVRTAADAAGIDASDISEDHCRTAVTVAKGPETEQSGGGMHGSVRTSRTLVRKSMSPDNRIHVGIMRLSPTSASWPSRRRPRSCSDYAIWINYSRAIRLANPPVGIVPFLGARQFTFAGRLYWACTEYLISLCRLVTAPYSPSSWFGDRVEARPSPEEAEDRVWGVLRHSPPIPNVHFAEIMIEAQFECRDTVSGLDDSTINNEDIGALQQEVKEDYLARGHDMRSWMTITDLEKHVRQQLGNEAFSRLEEAIGTTPSRVGDGELASHSDAFAIARLLIKNLAESYICFGDGPRWRTDSVSTLFSGKMVK
ncbi:hypothetical protein F4777DRAFT_28156 [Nemania sp. FL0916]|nr:hypothetical protein F4777DRAFT_28156 [Nemania sp. FL0916]